MMKRLYKGIRVLVADDYAVWRKGISEILRHAEGIHVVGEAENGLEAIAQSEILHPDVILMDDDMPRCDGLEAARTIKAQYPNIRVLVLSDGEERLLEAIKSGATGYVLKNIKPVDIIDSVKKVYAGEHVIPEHLAVAVIPKLFQSIEQAVSKRVELTEREQEVLCYLSTGASNRDIASALLISENTVQNHVGRILKKLSLGNRAQAAAYAVREGFTLETDRT